MIDNVNGSRKCIKWVITTLLCPTIFIGWHITQWSKYCGECWITSIVVIVIAVLCGSGCYYLIALLHYKRMICLYTLRYVFIIIFIQMTYPHLVTLLLYCSQVYIKVNGHHFRNVLMCNQVEKSQIGIYALVLDRKGIHGTQQLTCLGR